MMSKNILKGGFSYAGSRANAPGPVEFQFNPETITRTQVFAENANTVHESIHFELILHAMDGLAQADPLTTEEGIYPQLAALEEIIAYQRRRRSTGWLDWLFGIRTGLFLQFHYGDRSIPVRLLRMRIREVIHNEKLKPLHAMVDISLRVLSERDLRGNHDGLEALARYQQGRARLAAMAVKEH